MKFLKNAWYVGAWASEVTRALMPRTLLGQPVLFYRKENGQAVAIGNRCPHRFAPLHMGTLVGDVVECGYHGLKFDCSGACVENPHSEQKIPASAKVPSYPLVERHGLLWIWMGDARSADPALIPGFGHLVSPALKTIGDQMHQKCNYAMVIDNLMDLTHVHYLHAPYQKVDAFLTAPHEVRQEGRRLDSMRFIDSTQAPMSFRPFLDKPDDPVQYWLNISWDAPGACQLAVGVVPAGRPRGEGLQRIGTHIVTPEMETTTHYFYASSRNYRLDDPAADQETHQWQQIGFHEQDKPMLEAVQAMMGTPDLDSLKPVLLSSDVAAVRVRRILQSLIDAESKREIPLVAA
ncbi:MAG TPA: aromatic ring-hydroxylating dioxygenase subunit alpha [Ramlibacter sp.]|nr:aromatic ring-hydroxylating dioxygenase subunit alpha [Ramlibacter sp.]